MQSAASRLAVTVVLSHDPTTSLSGTCQGRGLLAPPRDAAGLRRHHANTCRAGRPVPVPWPSDREGLGWRARGLMCVLSRWPGLAVKQDGEAARRAAASAATV